MNVHGPCASLAIEGARVAAFTATDTDLTGVRLRNVNLTGARIEAARLKGASVNGMALDTMVAQADRDAGAIARLEVEVAALKARVEALEQKP